MNKILKISLLVVLVLLIVVFCYFFVGKAPVAENIIWGIDFSQMQAEALKLDWKENYTAILDDLKAKNIKLHTQWDFVEGSKDSFYFGDIDWQINEAKARGANIIYVVGMKTGRWPECHVPSWASGLPKKEQQQEILKYIREVIQRYKGESAISAWQVENEPFFKFGICPWYDKNFLKEEVALVKSLDNTRPVIISESGEQSLWLDAAKIGDIVGSTMYRDAWTQVSGDIGFYFYSFLPPVFYWRKAEYIRTFFKKDVICVELQMEPWALKPFHEVSLQEQEKTMSLQRFKDNVNYAKASGFNKIYLWGAEWWYWLKEEQNKPEIWNEAKQLFY